MEIDKTYSKILEELQHNGRASNQDLANTVGISPAACWRRVKALETSGVIQRYSAQLSRQKLGFQLCAFVHVTLTRHEKSATVSFEQAILSRPEVQECFVTTGDADYILQVVTADIESFDKFIESFLLSMPQIAQLRSNIALREVKRETALPLIKNN